jgi:hypothetical protein
MTLNYFTALCGAPKMLSIFCLGPLSDRALCPFRHLKCAFSM